ncbi:hypothetical protein KUTeg_014026 [Tegillarca granosa]|uniref:Transcription initiation factor IIA subunit 1 n=1 Tax=Tegillarca granosa TaxID=220873 RepID=A0ABQ9EYT8_TEGGR|nr:hypothetical protein KUTeg_014026 [Tegillarca granosa]
MTSSQNPVPKLYKSVVDDVISNVREAFLDEGVDEQVLQELKQLWEQKLHQSKALDLTSLQEQETVALPATLQYAQVIPHQAQSTSRIQTVAAPSVPQAVPVPVQIATGGEISAPAATATMALPQGLFQQQLQALANQGLTLQATANGQFIIQALPQAQGAASQVTTTVNIPQQATMIQSQTNIPTVVQATQQQHQPPPPHHHHNQPHHQRGMYPPPPSHHHPPNQQDQHYHHQHHFNQHHQQQPQQQQQPPNHHHHYKEPLNSEDDISDADPSELFDTDNVVVCQYDKINRNKAKWKFHLKDGIMNLNGKDYVFQKATGDADW